jgi:outer membrane immunogenic protein
MKRIVVGCFGAFLLIAPQVSGSQFSGSQAFAADLPVKAPRPAAPAPSWTGFYVGGEIGGAWADPSVSYSPNDVAADLLVNGTLGVGGQQPFPVNSFNMSGVTGGLEAGYNWQVSPKWLVGIETDFNASNLKGTVNSPSLLQGPPLPIFTQNVTVNQTVDWYGTLRGRAGYLLTDDLLLFGTGGLAYGRVRESGRYSNIGPFLAPTAASVPIGAPTFSFLCFSDGSTCFSGASSETRIGYTLGGGAEWRFLQNWSVKAEYQYVNLGNTSLRMTATSTNFGLGPIKASFNASLVRDDFQVVRIGANYHF